MDAALIIGLFTYTGTVVLVCRSRWAHRCAECAYRRRDTHTTGRHRAHRPAPPTAPIPALPAPPAGTVTTPMHPARPYLYR